MMSFRRNSEAVQRAAERRRREDSALRLAAEVPTLESLRLEIEEWRSGGPSSAGPPSSAGGTHGADTKHIRRVVVGSAPALFLIPCGDSRCKDGGHDLTAEIMRELKNGEERFEGESQCSGRAGTAPCGRVLRYACVAEYKKG
jgi:hypothetical protein